MSASSKCRQPPTNFNEHISSEWGSAVVGRLNRTGVISKHFRNPLFKQNVDKFALHCIALLTWA